VTGTAHPTASPSPRAAGFLLVALLFLLALLPPEVHGSALAGAAALVTLAAALSFVSAADAAIAGAATIVLALAARFASAPGEAVEPAALVVLALVAALATSRLRPNPATLGAASAALVAVLGARALFDVAWGLEAAAEGIRTGAVVADADAVLNRLGQGRAYGGFSTPAALAGFLVLLLPAALAWTLSRTGRARWAGGAATLLGLAGVVATRSLTAVVAAGAALAIAALRRRIGARAVGWALAAVAALALGVALLRPDGVFSLAREDSPWRLRAGNVRVALEIAREHPGMGVGPGGYAEAFPAHRRAGDNESRFAHDLPAQLVAEWGIPAGLLLSAAFFALFVGPLLASRASWREPDAAAALGLCAFALHNLADFTAFLPSFAIAAGVLRGALAVRPARPPDGPARAAFVAVAIVAAIASGRAGLSRDALFDARDAAAAGERALADERALRAAALAPWDCDARLAAAQAVGREAALAHADAAVTASPVRASARAIRAELRASLGDVPGAWSDLSKAATLYPMRDAYALRRDEIARALGTGGGRR
jgi:hypothetical protein